MDKFLEKISKQLKLMTENEKDAWIFSQAKILPEWKRKDFYKSICGTKKVIDMPEKNEIDEFCEKVRNGDITVRYETHYVEFDDFGHFHDDWEYAFYDSNQAMAFISSVIRGCHDLIVLEEYGVALEILDNIIGLEFTIEDHPDTDDCCQDDFMSLNMAVYEGLLSLNRENLLQDYIEACVQTKKRGINAADKIVDAFEMELFRDCEVSCCMTISEESHLLNDIRKRLSEDLERFESEFNKKSLKEEYYWDKYRDSERIRHIKLLIEHFERE